MDGNMKNHRDVCLATHAGYAEYRGLPDLVKTGCPNTPDYKSRFCSLHKPSVPVQTGGSSSTIDKLIIGSRSTRQGKTYEVMIPKFESQKPARVKIQYIDHFRT